MGVTRRQLLALPAALILGACTKTSPTSADGASAGTGGPDELFAETASFETIAGSPQRVMVGITTGDGRVLHGGQVRFTFAPVDANDTSAPLRVDAPFLAVPRSATPPSKATIGNASDGIGVYAADPVIFPSAGFWTITIDVALAKAQRLETAVEVLKTARVPAPGEAAPKTQNPTRPSADMAIEAIDSRSGPAGLAELADPLLHRESVADVLAAGRPCVVIVSTPAFCVSKFCGPLTDIVAEIAREYADGTPWEKGVGFVHLEVWRSFEKNEVNRFAAEWILTREAAGNEPWIFLIDAKGTITARWDNLVSEPDLRAGIASLAR
jgi:hypothetical protein